MKSVNINHVKIAVRNFNGSYNFYKKIFRFLGLKKMFEVGENSAWGSKVVGFGNKKYTFEIQEGSRKFTKSKFNRERVGLDHIAFNANSKKDVDDFYEFLLKNKIKILHAPNGYPEYSKGYYAVFFLDPDNIILEFAFTS